MAFSCQTIPTLSSDAPTPLEVVPTSTSRLSRTRFTREGSATHRRVRSPRRAALTRAKKNKPGRARTADHQALLRARRRSGRGGSNNHIYSPAAHRLGSKTLPASARRSSTTLGRFRHVRAMIGKALTRVTPTASMNGGARTTARRFGQGSGRELLSRAMFLSYISEGSSSSVRTGAHRT